MNEALRRSGGAQLIFVQQWMKKKEKLINFEYFGADESILLIFCGNPEIEDCVRLPFARYREEEEEDTGRVRNDDD